MEMEKKEPKIKIYISCHKESYIPENKLLYPVQVGAKLAKERFCNMQHDDDGENISEENRRYCELTTQYWAWKNEQADYYGFFHYRRYLSFNPVHLEEDIFGNVYYDRLDEKSLKELWIEESKMKQLISQYDIVTSQPLDVSNIGKTVYGHYKLKSDYHHIQDLDLALEIINEIYPEYAEAASEYVNSSLAYFCNLYIMKKEIFYEYNKWVFHILEEHNKRSNFDTYSFDEARVYGFLSERLFGIYYTYKKKDAKLKTKELQRTLFGASNPKIEIKPAFNKNNIPIVLAGDNNYVPYMTTLLTSILQNSNKKINYDVIILHNNISENNRKKMQKEFIGNDNLRIVFYDMGDDIKDYRFSINTHFKVENYFRLCIPQILKNYEKVIYLDSDLIVLGNIEDLYSINIGNNLVGAIRDIDWIAGYYGADNYRKEYEKKYLKLKEPNNYFNSGVMIWNIKEWKGHVRLQDVLELASKEEWMFVDQDVLNIICDKKVYFLPEEWNVLMNYNLDGYCRVEAVRRYVPKRLYEGYIKAREKANIVHYAGNQKPWRYIECDFSEYFWKYARETNSYEMLLQNVFKAKEAEVIRMQPENNGNNLVTTIDNQGIKIKGVDDTIYVDGVMVKLINSFNKRYPIGSKKRARLRKIIKRFVK